jgi:hypothetical protein
MSMVVAGADEPIDLTVATHAVWLRGAILFGAGLLVLVGYGTFMVAAKPAKCGQPMSPVR